jgi:hypothetical protein
MAVDTLGLMLRVLVTAASVPERDGGKQVLNKVRQTGKSGFPPAYDLGRWRQ